MVSINKIIPSRPTKAVKPKYKQEEKPLNEAYIRHPESKEPTKQVDSRINHIDERI
ncbi:MAG: hypothetical protein KBT50_07425 [Cycloclasticus sp.]|nr:hypothetical protein [Cycloclasticus sp.]